MIIATLSVGERYDNLSSVLLKHLSSVGNAVVVSTLNQSHFQLPIKAAICPQDGTYVWHLKRHSLRAGLERSQSVVFIDGDYCLRPWYRGTIPLLPEFETDGLWSCSEVINLGSMRLHHLNDEDTLSLGKSKVLLDQASQKFGLDWKSMVWWGDCLFGISDINNKFGLKFVDFWDRFAEWVRDEIGGFNVLSYDGVAMAFAASYCGITPKSALSYFAPIRASFQHLGSA